MDPEVETRLAGLHELLGEQEHARARMREQLLELISRSNLTHREHLAVLQRQLDTLAGRAAVTSHISSALLAEASGSARQSLQASLQIAAEATPSWASAEYFEAFRLEAEAVFPGLQIERGAG